MSLKSSISSHVRISYRFYQFVTTGYTTDFYIMKQNIPVFFFSIAHLFTCRSCNLLHPALSNNCKSKNFSISIHHKSESVVLFSPHETASRKLRLVFGFLMQEKQNNLWDQVMVQLNSVYSHFYKIFIYIIYSRLSI